MSQPSKSSACGDDVGANIDVGASLLVTGKYTKRWRKSYYIGILISLRKSTTASESPPSSPQPSPSPAPYTPLSPSEPPAPAPAPAPARTSSSKSSTAIDIASDAEEEREEVVEQRRQRIWRDIDRIVKEQDLKSLIELGGVGPVCSVLGQQRQHSEEGTFDNENHRVLSVDGTSFFSFLLSISKCDNYTISMLILAALTFAAEFKQEGPRYGWHDGVAIVVAVILRIAFRSMTNIRRVREMMKLSKRKDKLKFTVQRGEEGPLMAAISDIVAGDTVCLKMGDEVPAHGLFLDGDNFVLAEARSKSDHESNPFLIAGSKVIEGHGRMVVTSVENKRNLAELMQSSLICDTKRRGLLERRIEKPISCVENFALFISVLVALVALIRVICKKDGDSGGLPDTKGNASVGLVMQVLERTFLRPRGRISTLIGFVFVAVLFVQHGMPFVVTISLKYQSDAVVSNHDAVLNDLSACTTMGLVTVICIDASGGLTSRPLEVSRMWVGEKYISKVEGTEVDQVVLDVLQQGVGLSVLAPELPLSPLSSSLISWAKTTWGMNIESFTEEFNILKHIKLDSGKEGSGVLVRKVGDNEQVLHLHWSGAASTVLDMCSLYYDSKGECHAMENQKIKFGQVIKEMEDSGLKPIAFAHKQTMEQELEQDELILLGLIGLKHTCQESTRLALEYLRNTGIQIKLVSEDDIMVVKEIACELGIEVPVDGIVLEGKELQDLNGIARLDKVDLARLMGSFRPEDKLLMVQCLQEKGHVVAFIGRRMKTNHVSVLQVADVGIVHDSLGTIVDNDSSGITIKCFSALKPIVMAGRSKYKNIQKFIQLQLTLGVSGSLISLITAIFTGDSPLASFQLIWVNVLMSLLGGLMMAVELNGEEQLGIQTSDRNQSIMTKEIWKSIVIQVLYQTSASMILEFGGHITDIERELKKTMIFNTFLLCQVFNLLNTIHLLKKKVLKVVFQSYYFLGTLALCFLAQVLVNEYAKCLANCMRLNAPDWAISVLVGVFSCAFEWAFLTLPVILSTNYASESNTSPFGFSNWSRWFYLSWGFPFLMLLCFPGQINII